MTPSDATRVNKAFFRGRFEYPIRCTYNTKYSLDGEIRVLYCIVTTTYTYYYTTGAIVEKKIAFVCGSGTAEFDSNSLVHSMQWSCQLTVDIAVSGHLVEQCGSVSTWPEENRYCVLEPQLTLSISNIFCTFVTTAR